MTYATANKERCVVLANYLVENKATVRAVAGKFGISKSTVHKDVTQTLRHVNPALSEQVKEYWSSTSRSDICGAGKPPRKNITK